MKLELELIGELDLSIYQRASALPYRSTVRV